MVHLRAAKIAGIADDIPLAEIVGDEDAELCIVGWGSTWAAIDAAVQRTRRAGTKLAWVHITHLNPLPKNLGELLRTLAFAASPGLLRVVGAIPILRWPTFLVTALWMLLAMVVAVRHALDYRSTARAIGVCVLGWALSLAVAAAIGILFATPVS